MMRGEVRKKFLCCAGEGCQKLVGEKQCGERTIESGELLENVTVYLKKMEVNETQVQSQTP